MGDRGEMHFCCCCFFIQSCWIWCRSVCRLPSCGKRVTVLFKRCIRRLHFSRAVYIFHAPFTFFTRRLHFSYAVYIFHTPFTFFVRRLHFLCAVCIFRQASGNFAWENGLTFLEKFDNSEVQRLLRLAWHGLITVREVPCFMRSRCQYGKSDVSARWLQTRSVSLLFPNPHFGTVAYPFSVVV